MEETDCWLLLWSGFRLLLEFLCTLQHSFRNNLKIIFLFQIICLGVIEPTSRSCQTFKKRKCRKWTKQLELELIRPPDSNIILLICGFRGLPIWMIITNEKDLFCSNWTSRNILGSDWVTHEIRSIWCCPWTSWKTHLADYLWLFHQQTNCCKEKIFSLRSSSDFRLEQHFRWTKIQSFIQSQRILVNKSKNKWYIFTQLLSELSHSLGAKVSCRYGESPPPKKIKKKVHPFLQTAHLSKYDSHK